MASPCRAPQPAHDGQWVCPPHMTERVPRILREVQEANPDYPASVQAA